MGFPQIGDNDDDVVELLAQIARNTGTDVPATTGGSVSREVNYNQEYNQYDGGDESASAYFSTGKNGVMVPGGKVGEGWEKLELGMTASTVNIRAPVGINVAFANPNVNSGRAIPLTSEELPFTIGGDTPIRANTLWVQLRAQQDNPAQIHVIAFK